MARVHEDWLAAYMEHTRISEAPDIFHFWAGVSTLAGALRRRVWIEEYKYQIVPNFYIALVAPPGLVKKSTAMRVGVAMLEKIPGIKIGPQSITWQALTKALEQSQVTMPWLDKRVTMSCLTIAIGELGTFLKPADDGLLSALIAMWDGQLETWAHVTLGSGETRVVNPWLNIIGCTTPAWLRTNFPDLILEGGLISRVVFVYADKKRMNIAFPSRQINGAVFDTNRTKLIADLGEIAQLKGAFTITEGAYKWGEAWYAELDKTRPVEMSADRYAGFYSRKFIHAMKLAMVLSVSRGADLIIEEEDMILAAEKLEELEKPMMSIFQDIGTGYHTKYIREVTGVIRTMQIVPVEMLYKMLYNRMTRREFDEAVFSAKKAGIIEMGILDGKLTATWVKPTNEQASSQ